MTKEELIERIEKLPYFEGPIAVTVTVNREWILESIKQLDEPQKVTIPQFVAEWIEECKNDDFHLFGAMESISSNQKNLIIGLEKMTTWNSLLVLGWTATQSRKKSGIG